MRKMCRLELKRALDNKGTWIVFGIILLVVFMDAWFYHDLSRDSGKYTYPDLFILGWLPMDYQFVFGSLFRAMLPLVAAIPHGASFYRDKTSGYIKNICIKVSKRKYYTAKYVVTFIMGAMMIMVPLIISLMLVLTYLPIVKPQPFAFQGIAGNEFSLIYYSNPFIYACIYLFINGMFGAIAAVISLCISDFAKSQFSVIVLPFTIYLFGGALLEQMDLSIFSVYDMANPHQDFPVNGWVIGFTVIVGVLITFYQFCIKKTREDVL